MPYLRFNYLMNIIDLMRKDYDHLFPLSENQEKMEHEKKEMMKRVTTKFGERPAQRRLRRINPSLETLEIKETNQEKEEDSQIESDEKCNNIPTELKPNETEEQPKLAVKSTKRKSVMFDNQICSEDTKVTRIPTKIKLVNEDVDSLSFLKYMWSMLFSKADNKKYKRIFHIVDVTLSFKNLLKHIHYINSNNT